MVGEIRTMCFGIIKWYNLVDLGECIPNLHVLFILC